MPITNANGIDLYYEIHGEGEPLLLIMGLGLNSKSWFRTLPALSKQYKVIIFDNRGTGSSGKPNTPYSIELPQFNTFFSRILAYSQDFITLGMDLTIK